MNLLLRLLGGFFFLLVTIPAFPNKPHILNIHRETYRADNKNWSIGQDERGVMYFGNDIGLLEFDGIEWTLHSVPNSVTARSVAVLSHQTVFTGSYEEFGRWDRDFSGKLRYTSLSASLDKGLLKNDDFWKIWITPDRVYFQSFSSIFIYDFHTVQRLPAEHGFLFLTKVRDEFLVQQMSGPLFRLKGEKLEKIGGSDFLSRTDVRVILPYGSEGENQYLVGTSTMGIFLYDGRDFREWNRSLSEVMKSKELNYGLFSSRGTYFFGTILDGIYVTDLEGRVTDHLSSDNYLQNNTVLALYEDRSHHIWAGLDRGIAFIQYDDRINSFTDPGGKTGAVYCAIEWKDRLFLGTNQGVFSLAKSDCMKPDALSHLRLINGTQGQVWSLRLIGGRLYCCHNKGLKEIRADLTVADAFSVGTGVYELSEGSLRNREYLLLSTYQSLRMIDRKTQQVYTFRQIGEPVKNVEIDHMGNIWMEHFNRGVYRCKPEEDLNGFRQFVYYGGNSKDGLPYKLKLFKVGGRIELLGDDRFYTYDDIEDRIVLNTVLDTCFRKIRHIRQIIPIREHLFWALTRSAVYLFSYDGYEASILDHYNLGSTLSLVYNYENISVLNDSLSLICLDNGFLLYDLRQKGQTSAQATLSVPFIESVQMESPAGKTAYADPMQSGKIPYRYNAMTFRFLATHSFTLDLSFQYKLDPVDAGWSTSAHVNQVSYDRLPYGNYTFQVRVIDNQGNLSDAISYSFEVLPPWYHTYWAYLLYILLVLILGFVTWNLILRRYRNIHLQKIRARETRRLRTLADKLQDEVEQKNAELLTQTSFIIQKNELILKVKSILDEFYAQSKSNTLLPLYRKVNSLLHHNVNSEEDWKTFLFKFQEKHTGFFKTLKTLYPQLTNSDLRLCACLKLNMETKEIASLMNLSIRAVENSRYRLRKKLNLQPSQNLNDFFLTID